MKFPCLFVFAFCSFSFFASAWASTSYENYNEVSEEDEHLEITERAWIDAAHENDDEVSEEDEYLEMSEEDSEEDEDLEMIDEEKDKCCASITIESKNIAKNIKKDFRDNYVKYGKKNGKNKYKNKKGDLRMWFRKGKNKNDKDRWRVVSKGLKQDLAFVRSICKKKCPMACKSWQAWQPKVKKWKKDPKLSLTCVDGYNVIISKKKTTCRNGNQMKVTGGSLKRCKKICDKDTKCRFFFRGINGICVTYKDKCGNKDRRTTQVVGDTYRKKKKN